MQVKAGKIYLVRSTISALDRSRQSIERVRAILGKKGGEKDE